MVGLLTLVDAGSYHQVSRAATAGSLAKSRDYTRLPAKCRAGRGKATKSILWHGRVPGQRKLCLKLLAYFANAAIASITSNVINAMAVQ